MVALSTFPTKMIFEPRKDTSKVSAIDVVVALIATAWSVSKRKRINSGIKLVETDSGIKLVNIASSHSRSSNISCSSAHVFGTRLVYVREGQEGEKPR
jgi:hypothetical protein